MARQPVQLHVPWTQNAKQSSHGLTRRSSQSGSQQQKTPLKRHLDLRKLIRMQKQIIATCRVGLVPTLTKDIQVSILEAVQAAPEFRDPPRRLLAKQILQIDLLLFSPRKWRGLRIPILQSHNGQVSAMEHAWPAG